MLRLLLSLALPLGQVDEPPPAPAEPPAAAAPAQDRWLLMRSLQGTYPGWLLDDNRLSISGWTELSFTASSDRDSNLPMGFNYRANDFLLQQNWLRVERSVVTSGTSEPSFGFRSDTILPGSDYRFTIARGLFSSQDDRYGFDPVQFYAEAYFPTVGQGLDIKVGRFFAQFGVETIDAPSNALASHGYTMIYNPFTHTGVVATLKLNDAWSVQSGVVLGSDVFIDAAAEPTYIGGVKWAVPDGRDSVQFGAILGSGRFNQAENFHDPEIFDLVWTHRFNPRLSYNFEALYGFTTNVPDVGFANWLGIINYLSYDFTPRLTGNVRLEFFDDPQGQRTGFEGLYTALTAGLTFRPLRDVIIRPEVRYDYNSDSRPFEDKHGLFTAAVEVIFRW
jgi:hypothetical protein